MVAKTSHSPEDRKPLEPRQLGCRVGFDRHGIRPSLLPEGEVLREVPCCGKRAQSQLRENKKYVNTGLIKGGRPATPPQAIAGGRSLLGRVVTSTAALFLCAWFPITNLLRFGCVQRCISRAALKSGLMSKGLRFVRTGIATQHVTQ